MSQRDCPTCPSRVVTDDHVAKCADIARHRSEAVALGNHYSVPAATTADLWAHLGHIGSLADSTRIIRHVLDLGWRPVVGNDTTRLWSPATETKP